MRKKLTAALIVVVLSAACGRSALRRDQKQYETVEEGSASGVTSTIQGPGETLPPITDTNADGTSAFALDPNVGTAAPSYPVTPAPVATASVPTTTVATTPLPERRPPTPAPVLEPTPAHTETTATQPPEPPPVEKTDTATTQPPAEDDTAETTTTEEPPAPPPFAG